MMPAVKHMLLLIGTIFLLPAARLSAGDAGVPMIAIEPNVIDLGVISEVSYPAEVAAAIHNRGAGVLHIAEVTSVGANLRLRIDERALPSFGITALRVNMAQPENPGPWHVTVLVFSNDPTKKAATLLIKAVVVPYFVILPNSVVIDQLREHQHREVTVQILGPLRSRDFTIQDITLPVAGVVASSVREVLPSPAPERRAWMVALVVRARGIPSWKETVAVSTSDANRPVINIPFHVREVGNIRATPPMVCLPLNRNRQRRERIVIAAESDSSIPNIQKIDGSECLGWQYETSALSGTVRLDVWIRPDCDPHSLSMRQNLVVTFEKGAPVLDIPVLLVAEGTGGCSPSASAGNRQ